ncbi:MAG TPA: extracellular solute-binding protein [Actinomycetales bacterium]|nr:extracellular solute-binding protein [Actinomycetales bacterium]
MKLSLCRAAAGIAACLVLAACTGGSSSSDTSSQKGATGTIKYLIEEPEDAAALKALKKHIGTFTQSSGIDVKVSTLPTDTMRTVLQTQLRSGEGPDVFSWGSGPGFGGALANAGLLYDLTDAYQKYDWKVYDWAKQRVTFNGKTYGIPGEMETVGIFYNKKIFDRLGIDQPESLSELATAAKRVKAAGLVPLAVSDKEGWEGGHLLSMALSSAVGADGMKALLDGDKSWDSPQVTSSLSLWDDYNKAGYLPKSPTSVDYDGATAMFYSGKAAMIPTGSWLVGEIDDNTSFPVGYIPFPAPDGPGIFAGGLGSGPFISANSNKKSEDLKFLNFLASPEHGRWTVENLHTIPPQPIDTQGLNVSPLFAKVLKDTAHLSRSSGGFGYNIDVLSTDVFNEAMFNGVQAVLTGQQTPEDVASKLQDASKQ